MLVPLKVQLASVTVPVVSQTFFLQNFQWYTSHGILRKYLHHSKTLIHYKINTVIFDQDFVVFGLSNGSAILHFSQSYLPLSTSLSPLQHQSQISTQLSKPVCSPFFPVSFLASLCMADRGLPMLAVGRACHKPGHFLTMYSILEAYLSLREKGQVNHCLQDGCRSTK